MLRFPDYITYILSFEMTLTDYYNIRLAFPKYDVNSCVTTLRKREQETRYITPYLVRILVNLIDCLDYPIKAISFQSIHSLLALPKLRSITLVMCIAYPPNVEYAVTSLTTKDKVVIYKQNKPYITYQRGELTIHHERDNITNNRIVDIISRIQQCQTLRVDVRIADIVRQLPMDRFRAITINYSHNYQETLDEKARRVACAFHYPSITRFNLVFLDQEMSISSMNTYWKRYYLFFWNILDILKHYPQDRVAAIQAFFPIPLNLYQRTREILVGLRELRLISSGCEHQSIIEEFIKAGFNISTNHTTGVIISEPYTVPSTIGF